MVEAKAFGPRHVLTFGCDYASCSPTSVTLVERSEELRCGKREARGYGILIWIWTCVCWMVCLFGRFCCDLFDAAAHWAHMSGPMVFWSCFAVPAIIVLFVSTSYQQMCVTLAHKPFYCFGNLPVFVVVFTHTSVF